MNFVTSFHVQIVWVIHVFSCRTFLTKLKFHFTLAKRAKPTWGVFTDSDYTVQCRVGSMILKTQNSRWSKILLKVDFL